MPGILRAPASAKLAKTGFVWFAAILLATVIILLSRPASCAGTPPAATLAQPTAANHQPGPAPAWIIEYGNEFWQERHATESNSLAGLACPPASASRSVRPLDTAAIIERVSHAFARGSASSWPEVNTRSYQARFEADGLRFIPAAPGYGMLARQPGSPIIPAVSAKLRTLTVALDHNVLFSRTDQLRPWWVAGNTVQSLLDSPSGLIEHFEALANGVSVTWILSRPLKAGENLVIEAEMLDVTCAGQTDTGLHFADVAGLARVRLGHATAVDSHGQRWSVPIQAKADRIRINVPALVLAQANYPLAIDPLIAPEFGLDEPLPGVNTAVQSAPAVTAFQNGYFVVWARGKSELTDPAICGVRIDSAGSLLDPYGIGLGTIAAEQSTVAVAASDTNLLAVWTAPHGTSTTDWDIYGARLSFAGALLDTAPLTICGVSGVQASPAIAVNDNRYLVVWRDSRGTGGSIYGTLVSPDGTVSLSAGIPICAAAGEQYTPAVAALGTNFLVVWQDYRKATSSQFYADIFGARITRDGAVLDAAGFAICTKTNSQFNPAVAVNGTNCLVVWEDYNFEGNDIYGARVGLDGTVMDTNSFPIGQAFNLQTLPALTPYGDGFLVVWQDYRSSPATAFAADIFGARISAAGTVLDPAGIALSTAAQSQYHPAIAAQGDEYLAVWQDQRDNPGTVRADIYGVLGRISDEPAEHPEFLLSRVANTESTPAVAFNGTDYWIVWADDRNRLTNGWDIYGIRVAGDGTVRDANAIPICLAPNDQLSPAIAANGSQLLVVWTDRRANDSQAGADIYGARISAAGTILDTNGIAIGTAAYDQTFPAVNRLATNYLVVWQDARNSLTNAVRWDIYGARMDSAGLVLDPAGLAISTAANNQTAPAIAGNGANCLVAWTDNRSGTVSDIYGARLDGAGTVLDPNGLKICTAANNQTAPAIAANGANYLVAWTDARSSTANLDIYGGRVSGDGVVQDSNGFAIRAVPNQQSAPTVIANGGDFIVAWQDAPAAQPNDGDLYCVAVNGAGLVLTNTFMAINASMGGFTRPVMASDGAGRFLVAGQGSRFGAIRAVANWSDFSLTNNAPARLHSPQSMPGAGFRLTVSGEPGPRFRVEASENLAEWFPLETIAAINGTVQFTDATATNLNRRFYRAITIP